MEEVKLSAFSQEVGKAIDSYANLVLFRIQWLESKIIEWLELTNDEKFKEFFEIEVNEPQAEPTEEPIKEVKKPKMRVIKNDSKV